MSFFKFVLSLLMIIYTFIILIGSVILIDVFMNDVSSGWLIVTSFAIGILWVVPIGLALHLKRFIANSSQADLHK